MTDYLGIAIAMIVAGVPLIAIIGGLVIAALAIRSRARLRTLAHQERLAMIERGMTPPAEGPAFPDLPPWSWDDMRARRYRDAMKRARRYRDDPARRRASAVGMLGFGLALAVLVWVGGDAPRAAVGIGGSFGVLALTIFVISFMAKPESAAPPEPPPTMSEPATASGTEPPPVTPAPVPPPADEPLASGGADDPDSSA